MNNPNVLQAARSSMPQAMAQAPTVGTAMGQLAHVQDQMPGQSPSFSPQGPQSPHTDGFQVSPDIAMKLHQLAQTLHPQALGTILYHGLQAVKKTGQGLMPKSAGANISNPPDLTMGVSDANPIQNFLGKFGYSGKSQEEGGAGWMNPMNVSVNPNEHYQGGPPQQTYVGFIDKRSGPQVVDEPNAIAQMQSRLDANRHDGFLLRYDQVTGQHQVYNPEIHDWSPALAGYTPYGGYSIHDQAGRPLYTIKQNGANDPSWQVKYYKQLTTGNPRNGQQFPGGSADYYTPAFAQGSDLQTHFQPDMTPVHQ